jgi:hypothetical protein
VGVAGLTFNKAAFYRSIRHCGQSLNPPSNLLRS